jgi:hypothetical protein
MAQSPIGQLGMAAVHFPQKVSAQQARGFAALIEDFGEEAHGFGLWLLLFTMKFRLSPILGGCVLLAKAFLPRRDA